MTPKQKDKIKRDIGKRISNLSEKLYGPRKQYKLAKALKMSQGSLSDIINGHSYPSCLTIIKLARLINAKGRDEGTIEDILGV